MKAKNVGGAIHARHTLFPSIKGDPKMVVRQILPFFLCHEAGCDCDTYFLSGHAQTGERENSIIENSESAYALNQGGVGK